MRDEMTEGFDTSNMLTQAPPSATRWEAIVSSELRIGAARGNGADAEALLLEFADEVM